MVAIRLKPRRVRKYTIHFPGFGSLATRLGLIANNKYGIAIPSPNMQKIAIISSFPRLSAKLIEVPTKGAEHGVARSVAKAPVKKLSAIHLRPLPL